LTTPPSLQAPSAQHEHATLVSVVHPSPRLSDESFHEPTVRRRRPRAWVPSALALGCVLAAGLGWASMHQLRAMDRGAASSPRSPNPARPPAAVAAAAPAATVAALPPAPLAATVVDRLPSESKPAAPKPYVAVNSQTTALPATRTSMLRATPRPVSSALPQALPARENHSELLNPY